MWLHWNQSFDYDILNSIESFVIIQSLLFKVLLKRSESPLGSKCFICLSITHCKAECLFIHWIISEMHESLLQCSRICAVFLGSETNQALFEEINSKWIKARYKYVETEIIFSSVDEVRSRNITTSYPSTKIRIDGLPASRNGGFLV